MKRQALKRTLPTTHVLEIGEQEAVRIAGEWVRRHLPDRLCTGEPTLTVSGHCWRAPILLAYPFLLVGEVGEVCIAADSGEIVSHTSVKTMKANANRLGTKHRAEIEAAFAAMGIGY
jgi:hypothetical protein